MVPTNKKFRWWHFVLIFVFLAAGYVWISGRRLPLPRTLPVPNGYTDFQKAIAATAGDPKAARSGPTNELRTYIEKNQEPLRQIRDGLTKQCQVPVEYTTAYINNHLPELGGIKALALVLEAEGQLAEKDGRLSDAIKSYLDGIRFSHDVARGGLLIDQVLAIACEAIAVKPLNALRSRLAVNDCRLTAKALEKIELNREKFATVLTQERIWASHTGGWRYQLFGPIFRRMSQPAIAKTELKTQFREAHLRLLMLELALHAYQLEKGQLPQRLDELVPGFLTAVPPDPFSKNAFIYHPGAGSFVVYSVGADGNDDGGTSPADILADTVN